MDFSRLDSLRKLAQVESIVLKALQPLNGNSISIPSMHHAVNVMQKSSSINQAVTIQSKRIEYEKCKMRNDGQQDSRRQSRESWANKMNCKSCIPKQIIFFFFKSCTYIYLYIWSSEIIGASRLILWRITYTNVRKSHPFTASECVTTAECADQIENWKKCLYVSDPYSILMYVNCISLVAETRSHTWRRNTPNHVLFCRNFCHFNLLLGYYHQKWLASFQNYWSIPVSVAVIWFDARCGAQWSKISSENWRPMTPVDFRSISHACSMRHTNYGYCLRKFLDISVIWSVNSSIIHPLQIVLTMIRHNGLVMWISITCIAWFTANITRYKNIFFSWALEAEPVLIT